MKNNDRKYHGWIHRYIMPDARGTSYTVQWMGDKGNQQLYVGTGLHGVSNAVRFFEEKDSLLGTVDTPGLGLGPVYLEATPLGTRVYTPLDPNTPPRTNATGPCRACGVATNLTCSYHESQKLCSGCICPDCVEEELNKLPGAASDARASMETRRYTLSEVLTNAGEKLFDAGCYELAKQLQAVTERLRADRVDLSYYV